ncbi:MAG: cell division protein FtsQ [Alteromonadaceae bacterium]|nr:cell division protein FtsQ [Alteromonadaceae bacterium]MBH84688.1 cell division protein FtsQ [Alteromonadaceae bacterium]|tara:strand:- start:10444 stop:11289 length:846 start_codon:yes stop_codon:yes gene_type:complete
MIDLIHARGRQPQEPPRRRGASSMEPEGRTFNMFQLLRNWFGPLPWMQWGLGVLVLVVAGLVPWGTGQVLNALDRQIADIEIKGDLKGLDRDRLMGDVHSLIGRSFFATDLEDVKQLVEKEPWVESAAVRRVWPDRLAIEVREERPLAYWNKAQIIGRSGHVFQPENPQAAGALPRLSGPEDRVEEVVSVARKMATDLQEIGVGFAGLRLEKRGAWTLQMTNGIEVALGRDQVEKRFDRFVTVYQRRLASRAAEVERIDARYTNGVAVQWKTLAKAPEKNS